MFLTCDKRGYGENGQFIHGYFLMLVQSRDLPIGKDNFRATIVYSRYSQCGQFMMGIIRKFGQKLVLSGSYGSDGLPKTVSHDFYEKCTPIPAELYEKWAKGGGWNSAGSEWNSMREFGLELMKKEIKQKVRHQIGFSTTVL